MNRSISRLSLLLLVLAASPLRAQTLRVASDHRRITVSGEAAVNVLPDRIVASFGVETWDADIAVSKRKNAEVMAKAVEAIHACGIADRDVQTDHLSVEPRYDRDRGVQVIGYFARNAFVVTLSSAVTLEDLATRLLQAGVNYIHGVQFQTTELRKHRDRAREMALQAAREKAIAMAAALGQQVGMPLEIDETYSGAPPQYYSSWGGWSYGRGQMMTQNAVQDLRGSGGEITESIALGKISIRAGVSVTFELNDPGRTNKTR